MADAATARPSATSFISFGHKRIPSIHPYIFTATFVWLAGFIPIFGAIVEWCFTCFTLLWWYICDYRINFGGAKFIGVFLAEIVPGVPAPIWFVWTNYSENVRLTEPVPDESGNVQKSKAERLASLTSATATYARGKAGPEEEMNQKGGEGDASKRPGTQSIGYEQKGQRTGNGVVPPTSGGDKNMNVGFQRSGGAAPSEPPRNNAGLNVGVGPQGNKSMDGMVPPGREPQSAAYQPTQTQPIFHRPTGAPTSASQRPQSQMAPYQKSPEEEEAIKNLPAGMFEPYGQKEPRPADLAKDYKTSPKSRDELLGRPLADTEPFYKGKNPDELGRAGGYQEAA